MKERDILKIYNNYCVIGMSPDPEKYSYQIYQCLKNAGKHVYGISRQCLRDGVKSLEFIGFLGRQRRNYTLFIPLEDRIGKAEIII